MNKFIQRLPVSAKIGLAPFIAIVLLVLVALQANIGNRNTLLALHEMSDSSLPRIAIAGTMKERTVELYGMVMQSLAYEGAGLRPEVIGELDARINGEFQTLEKLIHEQKSARNASSDEAFRRISAVEQAFAKFKQSSLDTLDMKSAGIGTAAAMMTTAEKAYADLRGQLTTIVDKEMSAGVSAATTVEETVKEVNSGVFTLACIALILSGIVTWYANQLIVSPLGRAVVIASEVADGNLCQQPVAAGSDATGQVLLALAKVASRLNCMIDAIKHGSDEIDFAANEISMGNCDLAARTEHTAAALQATAASVSILAQTIHENATAAAQADLLAQDASRVAQRGGNDVAEVVRTMDGICIQSRRISEIINTIDGIAFQTNILALNAAVEAARAGEFGRGFAVVASEVRSLAQRSGDAAKEIRTLIAKSMEQVEAGSAKVQAAGETMHRIVSSIEQVSVMVSEISRATANQADGIRGVNHAVDDMDRSTQQNAALVQQSAAAAESLRAQADGLVRLISVFRVSQDIDTDYVVQQ